MSEYDFKLDKPEKNFKIVRSCCSCKHFNLVETRNKYGTCDLDSSKASVYTSCNYHEYDLSNIITVHKILNFDTMLPIDENNN